MIANAKQLSIEMIDETVVSFILPLCFSHTDEMTRITKHGYTYKHEGIVCYYPPSSVVKITSQPVYCDGVAPNVLPAPEDMLPNSVRIELT